jgi:hypothetical protein
MSYSHDKGYRAEAAVESLMRTLAPDCYRPRAGRRDDVGDIVGLPLVVSVKDHARLALAAWCDDLGRMVAASRHCTGVVWHKRAGRADPANWYVTTTGRLWLPMYEAWCHERDRMEGSHL